MINKKQYVYLQKQEVHLRQAMGNYLMGVYSDDVQYCKKIYNELGYEGPCVTCKTDIKTMYAILAKLFYEYQEAKINVKANEQEAK